MVGMYGSHLRGRRPKPRLLWSKSVQLKNNLLTQPRLINASKKGKFNQAGIYLLSALPWVMKGTKLRMREVRDRPMSEMKDERPAPCHKALCPEPLRLCN